MFGRKRHDDADLRYMRSLASAVVQRSPRYLILVVLMVPLVTASAVLWMAIAEVDVVVRGAGKVVPERQLQVVQSLEGGVVSEILVSEGERVEKDQPLAKISDVAFASSFEENQVKYIELRARIARLLAESQDSELVPDPLVLESSPSVMNAEQSLYASAKQQREQAQGVLKEQVRQQESALVEARAQRAALEKRLSLMREEIELKEPLEKRGIITRVELLQLRKQENEIESELEAVALSIPRLGSTIAEAKQKLEQNRLDFINTAKRELNESQAEAARLEETQTALQDRVRRTTLRAPVSGTISRTLVTTVGGVVPPGGPVVEIVPSADDLLVELEVEPKDVAKLQVGLPTRLKFTAYDFAIYGSIKGNVTFLSADTITDEQGESHYVARVKPEQDHFKHVTGTLPILVGMTVEADIITGKKTILQYLLKPINRGLQRALSEQ